MKPKYQLLGKHSSSEYEQTKYLMECFNRYGANVVIEVDENGDVLDGHLRLKIAKELGIDYILSTFSWMDEPQKNAMFVELTLNEGN